MAVSILPNLWDIGVGAEMIMISAHTEKGKKQMSNKDLANMIDIAFGILIVFGSILWVWLYLKLDKIYDELKEVSKGKKDVKHGECVTVCDEVNAVVELPTYLTDDSEEFEDKIKYELILKSAPKMAENLVMHKSEDITKDITKYATTIKFSSY